MSSLSISEFSIFNIIYNNNNKYLFVFFLLFNKYINCTVYIACQIWDRSFIIMLLRSFCDHVLSLNLFIVNVPINSRAVRGVSVISNQTLPDPSFNWLNFFYLIFKPIRVMYVFAVREFHKTPLRQIVVAAAAISLLPSFIC